MRLYQQNLHYRFHLRNVNYWDQNYAHSQDGVLKLDYLKPLILKKKIESIQQACKLLQRKQKKLPVKPRVQPDELKNCEKSCPNHQLQTHKTQHS